MDDVVKSRKRIYDLLDRLNAYIAEGPKESNPLFKHAKHGVNHRLIRKIIITPTKFYLTGPQLEMANRIIRTYKDRSDFFVRVTFTDEDFEQLSASESYNGDVFSRISEILDRNIDIGGFALSFLHYSNSQLRTQGCWFIVPKDDLTPERIRKRMGNFTNIRNPAKFGARMAQCFSSTTVTGKLAKDSIRRIKDVERDGFCFSDGVGRLGVRIADSIYSNLKTFMKTSKIKPSAYQFRMAGCKGGMTLLIFSLHHSLVLTVDPTIPEGEIQVRPSQWKFESEHYAMEICRSSFYSPGYLNRQFITILEALGVDKSVFLELKNEMVENLKKCESNPKDAIQILRQFQDDYGVSQMICTLIDSGFFQLQEVFLMNLLRLFYAIQVCCFFWVGLLMVIRSVI